MFDLSRRLLFRLPADTSHELTLHMLAAAERMRLVSCALPKPVHKPVTVFGIRFPNPVGLAAGLDKNGECIDAFAALGFGFIEIGTVTPRAQPGNPLPRIFRLPERTAIINRMGFNNHGVDALVANVRRARYRGVLGINIGKNKDTPNEHALDDYLHCLRRVYDHASYVTVNISSPNTPGLRTLQHGDALRGLLDGLRGEQDRLHAASGRRVPLLVKIAPDSTEDELAAIAAALVEFGIDGVIATNTTSGREGVQGLPHADETGGLSGAPLTARSTAVVATLARELAGRVPIVGVGGIVAPEHALAKRDAGASLVQVYTGFIYRGPSLVRDIAKAW
ncbi:MAG: quinone-dependent dihydroorotate dehydrogenase [Pseudomonadota bacterium]